MTDNDDLAIHIREELNFPLDRTWRILDLLQDIEMWLENGDVDFGARQLEIGLALELIRENASHARRDLLDMDQACARALGEDDLDLAA